MSIQKRLATVLQTPQITNKKDICAVLWLILEVIQKLCFVLFEILFYLRQQHEGWITQGSNLIYSEENKSGTWKCQKEKKKRKGTKHVNKI